MIIYLTTTPETAMKKLIVLFFITLGFFIPGYCLAATHDIHIDWSYDSQLAEGKTLAGYHLYKEGIETCTSTTPVATSMDCVFNSEDGTFQFTLTAFYADGSESPHSSPYTFILTSPPEPALLADFITTPSILSGNIPFTVSFNAASSTGDISSYIWNYGDSNTDSGSQVTHTYNTIGTYSAVLTVTDSQGNTSQKTVTINATSPQSSSNTRDIHIEWQYEFQPDGGRTLAGYYLYKEGEKICTSDSPSDTAMDCVFESEEGTFNFTLTAFCTDGYESPHSAPYTFTLGTSSDPNLTASFATDPISLTGETPFTIAFDATSSTGTISTYNWSFGDNSTDTGSQISHTFTSPGIFQATLTVTSTTGATSQHSVTVTATAPPEPPVAIISPATFSGDAPLTVSFDGSSSTNAAAYSWFFGDGATANVSQTNHTFATPGTYTTALTVTNDQGQTHSANVTITVNETTGSNTPPTAVISSSTAMGDAPLNISFNGTGSHDEEGPISSYLWNFGDGSQTSSTATTSHTYTTAGTFNASLTVTDSHGTTNTASTPVIITGQSQTNQDPTARMTASAVSGTPPLEVFFDGSTSSDPENSPLTFNWNFGDGAVAQGAAVSHVYTNPGSFTATLTVADDAGATSSSSMTINTEDTPDFQLELGEIEIDHNWKRVNFSNTFVHPIVVAGPPTKNDDNPCVVRMRNITSSGFDIHIQEWNYLDGSHTNETVAYLVLEKGSFTLEDGTMVEAGEFSSNSNELQTIQFNSAFTTEPVLVTSITSSNGEDAVASRPQNISKTAFEHQIQKQESLNTQSSETGSYIAWEPSESNIDNINIIVNKTADRVRNRWYTVRYGKQLPEPPIFFGTMQSLNGIDTSAIRYTNKTNREVKIMVEEEQSADQETMHTSESVGYFLFSADTTVPPAPSVTYFINFQPSDVPVPEGYLVDSGRPFDEEQGYGWVKGPYSMGTRDRNSSASPDQAYDTMIHVDPSSIWEINIPNGAYTVTICNGDASFAKGIQNVQINGTTIIDHITLSNETLWVEKTATITVTDGKLSVTFAGDTDPARLCWVTISSTH